MTLTSLAKDFPYVLLGLVLFGFWAGFCFTYILLALRRQQLPAAAAYRYVFLPCESCASSQPPLCAQGPNSEMRYYCATCDRRREPTAAHVGMRV